MPRFIERWISIRSERIREVRFLSLLIVFVSLLLSGVIKHSRTALILNMQERRIPVLSNLLDGITNPFLSILFIVAGICLMFTVMDILMTEDGTLDHMNRELSPNAIRSGMAPMNYEQASKFFEVVDIRDATANVYGYADKATRRVYTYRPLPTFYDPKKGEFLDMYHALGPHEALFGMTGQGKTTGYVNVKIITMALRGESFIATDTSGELPVMFYNWLTSLGYTVRVFNLMNSLHSDGYNMFSQFLIDTETPEQIAIDMAENWVNTYVPDKPNEFFANETKQILTLLLLTLYYDCYRGQGVLPTMNDLFTLIHKPIVELAEKFEGITENSPIYELAMDFCQKNDTAKQRGINGIQVMCQALVDPGIREMLSHNDIDPGLPGKQKCAYFMVVGPSDPSMHWVASMFVSNIYHALERVAMENISKKGKGLDIPTQFILDEVQSIFHIMRFPEKMNTCRKYNIVFNLIIQDIPGLIKNYGEYVCDSLLSACPTKIMLGTNDPTTLQRFSDYCGMELVLTEMRFTQGFLDMPATGSRQSEMEEPMFPPAFQQTLTNSQAIINSIGRSMLTELVFFQDMPAYEDIKKCGTHSVVDHVPFWKQQGEVPVVKKRLSTNQYIDGGDILRGGSYDKPLPEAPKAPRNPLQQGGSGGYML